MSNRPSSNRSKSGQSRRNRQQSGARRQQSRGQAQRPKAAASSLAGTAAFEEAGQGATPEPTTETRSATGMKTRANARRAERRASATKKKKQQQQLTWVMSAVAIAIVIAIVLIFVNRPSNDAIDIDYSGIPATQPQQTSNLAAISASPSPNAQGTPAADQYVGMSIGDPNAPVTLVVYADYQCPYCKIFQEDVYPKLVENYVKPGKLRIELREYPFLGGNDLADDGNESSRASQAALCAGDQGKYLEYHDKLFANQGRENDGNFSDKRLKQFADEIGLDTDQFNQCLDNDTFLPAVQASKNEGAAAGVSATPMFLLNGTLIQMPSGGYDAFAKQIDIAIKQSGG